MRVFDVVVVGGGPVGSLVARNLARDGFSVAILEKKARPGKRACSGLVSKRFLSLVPLARRAVIDNIRGVVFHGDRERLEARSGRAVAVVLDRPRLDGLLFDSAVAEGATPFTSTTFQDYTLLSDSVVAHTSRGSLHGRVLVGADGPASLVRRVSGLEKGVVELVNCAVYRAPRKAGDERGVVSLYLDQSVFPGFFGWAIPRGGEIEIGAGVSGGDPGVPLSLLSTSLGYGAPGDAEYSPVVYGLLEKTCTERIVLVGDAACQTKPFSGGGLTYGAIAAEVASRAIEKALDSGDASGRFFEEEYHEAWRRVLLDPILVGLGLRRVFNSLSRVELDTLLGLARQASRDLLSKGDMDLLAPVGF